MEEGKLHETWTSVIYNGAICSGMEKVYRMLILCGSSHGAESQKREQ